MNKKSYLIILVEIVNGILFVMDLYTNFLIIPQFCHDFEVWLDLKLFFDTKSNLNLQAFHSPKSIEEVLNAHDEMQ